MEEELKKLQEQIATLQKTVAEKDVLIAQKNQDLVGQRKQYKKLADMTQEEKDALSQKEIELQERQEVLDEQLRQFETKQTELLQKEVGSRKDAALRRIVGDNKEYAEKIRANFDKIKDSDKAITDDEVSALMNTAVNMLGDERPSPVSEALNSYGDAPSSAKAGGFADTPEGQQLAAQMGIAPAPRQTASAPTQDVAPEN
jgi:SMC interacting uncharacterized protein involved in chromosome segregation